MLQGFEKVGKQNVLERNIDRIMEVYSERKEEEKLTLWLLKML